MSDDYPYPKGRGLFAWGPRQTYNWPPFRIVRGHDECTRQTIGICTPLGAVFYAWPCKGCELDD